MIAIALALIGLVVMITTGVAVSSSGDDHLEFLGIGVETTTAQVFLTGAIFAWLFVIALLLLRSGLQRSNARCAQLAVRRACRAEARRSAGLGEWLGFGPADAQQADLVARGPAETLPTEVLPLETLRQDPYPPVWPHAERGGSWFGTEIGGAGAGGDDGRPPHRGDGGPDLTHRSVAMAGDQAGTRTPRHVSGPGARYSGVHGGTGLRGGWSGRGGCGGSGFLGIGVDRRGQGGQVGR